MLSEIKGKFFIKISQSLMFLPYFISWMVMGAILYAMLNVDSGLVNPVSYTHLDVYKRQAF